MIKQIIGLYICFSVLFGSCSAFTIPTPDGYVTDQAHILSQTQEQSLEQTLASIQTETSHQIAILILQSLE